MTCTRTKAVTSPGWSASRTPALDWSEGLRRKGYLGTISARSPGTTPWTGLLNVPWEGIKGEYYGGTFKPARRPLIKPNLALPILQGGIGLGLTAPGARTTEPASPSFNPNLFVSRE